MRDVRMAVEVSLKKIVEELECLFEGHLAFVDLETGDVFSISVDAMSAAEEGPEDDEEYDDDEEYQLARRIVASDSFVRLPTRWDIHEWQIMEEFAEEVGPAQASAELVNAVHGRGAFRHFKDTLRRHGIEEQWWDYRRQALREIAVEWCEEHKVKYRE